jgi:hypothetical protein
VQLEGLGQLKIPMTSTGIEFTTFRLDALAPQEIKHKTAVERTMAKHPDVKGFICG